MTFPIGIALFVFCLASGVLLAHYWRPTGNSDAGGFDAGSTSTHDSGGSSWFSDLFDGGGGGGDCGGGDSGGDCGGGGDSST
jgi:hypothetical protein